MHYPFDVFLMMMTSILLTLHYKLVACDNSEHVYDIV